MRRQWLTALAAAELLLLAVPLKAQREPPVPKELLERAAAAAERFQAEYQNLRAVETLQQSSWDRRGRVAQQREIVSEFWRLRLGPGGREAVEFADVLAVDGKAVGGAESREARHAQILAASSRQEIAALVDDPAKYRLGAEQLANAAMLVTRLGERNHGKLRYFFAQDTAEVHSEAVLMGYRQIAGEGLIAVDHTAVFPWGQAWVEPNDGRVIRIEEEFQHKGRRYWVGVDFERNENLGAWVPLQVVVRIFEKGRLTRQDIYTYSQYRRVEPAGRAAADAPPRPR